MVSLVAQTTPHEGYSVAHVEALLRLPLLELVGRASDIHRSYHPQNDIQKASLLSIKTGGCPEDCAYCPQSAHHKEVKLTREQLMQPAHVEELAKRALSVGAERFCMGAAWRKVRDGKEFDAVLEMVHRVGALGMETCVTLGMLEEHHALQLAEAGLTAYNHNLDTSPEFYSSVITTRTYRDRIETLNHVRSAGIQICCGGIIGMGESWTDRAELLTVLANFDPQPESVPINSLIPVAGTPLADLPPVSWVDMCRMVSAARILMPKSRVRLSAGRDKLSPSQQILCFMAGANSIFYGNVLLTAPNMNSGADDSLMEVLGPI